MYITWKDEEPLLLQFLRFKLSDPVMLVMSTSYRDDLLMRSRSLSLYVRGSNIPTMAICVCCKINIGLNYYKLSYTFFYYSLPSLWKNNDLRNRFLYILTCCKHISHGTSAILLSKLLHCDIVLDDLLHRCNRLVLQMSTIFSFQKIIQKLIDHYN